MPIFELWRSSAQAGHKVGIYFPSFCHLVVTFFAISLRKWPPVQVQVLELMQILPRSRCLNSPEDTLHCALARPLSPWERWGGER